MDDNKIVDTDDTLDEVVEKNVDGLASEIVNSFKNKRSYKLQNVDPEVMKIVYESLLNDKKTMVKFIKSYLNHIYAYEHPCVLKGNCVERYRPGTILDYDCNLLYSFLTFITDNNLTIKSKYVKEEMTKTYIESIIIKTVLLTEPESLTSYPLLLNKLDDFIANAYPDLYDYYSRCLYILGNDFSGMFYSQTGLEPDYKMALKAYKKGASFDVEDRQIMYPHYLKARNVYMLGVMHQLGIGTRKNVKKSIVFIC